MFLEVQQLLRKILIHIDLPLQDLLECILASRNQSIHPLAGEVQRLIDLRHTMERSPPSSNNNNHQEEVVEDLRTIDVLPTKEELSADEQVDPKVVVNCIDKPMGNPLKYLNTHFRLYREEYVGVCVFS
jgi:hypothetical protein